MIKQSSIDEVLSKSDLEEIVSRYVTVKKHQACCPFHDEKSPSFRIWQAKQVYKCFGCGESGGVITFLRMKERKTFVEAIEWLAEYYNISLEYDQQQQSETEETRDLRAEMYSCAEFAQKKYREAIQKLPADAAAICYLETRGYDAEKRAAWDIGFAPDSWDYLKTPLINAGKHNAAVEMGLITSKEGKNWDFFRNRITIPIYDQNGVIVGFGARWVPTGDKEEDKKQPKYLNSHESLIYSKRNIWYGLNMAQRAIKETGYVYVTEGFMDVQSMQDGGMVNTVASCGTEIDELQAKFLKRYTEQVVMCYDGDVAGTKKTLKQIDLFLKMGFKVGMIEFPEQMDPDEYIRHLWGQNERMLVAV